MAQFLPARNGAFPLSLLCGVLLLGTAAAPTLAQQSGYGQTLEGDSDPFETRPGSGGGSILDSANPLDLINRLRRSTALDDATPPGDAIDEALRDFENRSGPGSSPGSGVAPAP